MTNNECADSLEKFAAILRANEMLVANGMERPLRQPMIGIFCDTKEELVAAIRAIGGKWTKRMPADNNNEFGTIRLESTTLPPLFLHIYRNKVCRRTVKWDCEPFLSPEDEQEVATAMEGK
jgi:hypothetical protein